MLKYIGIFLIFLSLIFPIFEYKSKGRKIFSEYAYFSRLLGEIISSIQLMRPIGEVVRGSDTSDVLHIMKSGSELLSEPRRVADSLSMPTSLKEATFSYFSSLGDGSRTEELLRARSLLSDIESAEKSEREAREVGFRVRGALFVGIGLMLVIILV